MESSVLVILRLWPAIEWLKSKLMLKTLDKAGHTFVRHKFPPSSSWLSFCRRGLRRPFAGCTTDYWSWTSRWIFSWCYEYNDTILTDSVPAFDNIGWDGYHLLRWHFIYISIILNYAFLMPRFHSFSSANFYILKLNCSMSRRNKNLSVIIPRL